MSKNISDKTKKLRHYGEGHNNNYKPYITTSEFNSQGTTSVIKDWKTGRGVHCLSQGEMLWYYTLRWDDKNIDIREQFPLDVEETNKIAIENGFKLPGNGNHVMTTDFLVDKTDGTQIAYSVKANKDLSERALQLLCVEKIYWNNKGVDFQMLFKTDVNHTLVSNIRQVVEFYDAKNVFDTISAIKHKIAIKEYKIDLTKKKLTNDDLLLLLKEGIYE